MGTEKSESKKKKPAKKFRSSTKFLGLIGSLLVILALPVGGYALYVVNQLKEVEAQNLRTLAKAAGAVETLVENFRKNIENLAREPKYACDFQRRQTRLRLVSPGSCDEIDDPGYRYDPKAKITSEHADLQLSVFLTKTESGLKTNTVNAVAGEEKSKVTANAFMTWTIRFDQVLSDIPFGKGMDVLLIADHVGKVVKQHPDPAARPGDSISPAGSGDFAGRVLTERGVRINDLRQLKPIDDPKELFSELDQGTLIRTVIVAGTGYKMLCQPLVLNGLDVEKGQGELSSWILCGLVEEGRAFREALEVAPFLTVFLFSLFFFGLFLWPIAKILTTSPRERIRFADVYLLLLGTWGALMLATILTVTLDTYGSFKDAAAESLRQLADDIEHNFTNELTELHAQLIAYDLQLDADLTADINRRSAGSDKIDPLVSPKHFVPAELGNQTGLLNKPLPSDPDSDEPAYPFFSSVFWVEPCSGQQIAKATVRNANTPKVNVSSRDYYRKVQANDLWQLPSKSNARVQTRYYLQTSRSITTGEFFAAVSTPSRIGARPNNTDAHSRESRSPTTLEKFWANAFIDSKRNYRFLRERYGRCSDTPIVAAVMSGQLVSMTNPVLAPGVGFALLDVDGNVIFHSDERRAQFENLYEELGDGERLRAILDAGISSELDSNYRARPHQIYARRLDKLPWSVVTFLDDELLRTSFLESLMHGVMLMLGHLLLYFLSTLMFLFVRGRSSPLWMWPYISKRATDYRWLAWMLLVLLCGITILINEFEGAALLWLCVFLPMLPIAVFSFGPAIVHLRNGGHFVRASAVAIPLLLAIISGTAVPEELVWNSMDISSRGLAIVFVALWITGLVLAMKYPLYRLTGRNSASVRTASNSETLEEPDNPKMVTARDRQASLDAYMLTAILMWVLIALLPAYGYAKLVVTDQLSVLIKYENQSTLRQLVDREAAINEYYLETDLPSKYVDQRRNFQQKDIYRFSMYTADRDASGKDNRPAPSIGRIKRTVGEPEPDEADKQLQSAFPWRVLAGNMPIYNETSRAMRYYQQSSDADRRWTIDGRGSVTFRSKNPGMSTDFALLSRMAFEFPKLGILTLLATVFGLLIIVVWTRYGARRIFFGDIPPGPHSFATVDSRTAKELLEAPPYQKIFALITSPRDRRWLVDSGKSVNLMTKLSDEKIEKLKLTSSVVCDNFEAAYAKDPERTLKYLTKLSRSADRKMIILSSKGLRSILVPDDDDINANAAGSTGSDDMRADSGHDPERPAALADFVEVIVALTRNPGMDFYRSSFTPRRGLSRNGDPQWIRREIDAIPDLREVITENEQELSERYGTRREILEYIDQVAEPFYRALWNACTPDEHLVLVQLAQEGVANPKQQQAVRSLLNRGLLLKDPVLHIVNQSFALFASSIYKPKEVESFERSYAGFNWAKAKRILIVTVILVLVFLFTTQPAAVETLTKYLSGAAASVIAIITLANKLGGLKGTSSSP
jgi:hypothetical protein